MPKFSLELFTTRFSSFYINNGMQCILACVVFLQNCEAKCPDSDVGSFKIRNYCAVLARWIYSNSTSSEAFVDPCRLEFDPIQEPFLNVCLLFYFSFENKQKIKQLHTTCPISGILVYLRFVVVISIQS